MSESAIHNDGHTMSARTFVLAMLLVATLLALASYFIFSGPPTGVPSARAEINAKFAALSVQPHAVELTTEKALRFRAAVEQGDFHSATSIATEVLGQSHIENWRFHPFGQFMNGLSDLTDPSYQANLDKWVAQASKNAFARLVRAQFQYDLAWAQRGHGFSAKVDPHHMAAFGHAMVQALEDVNQSLTLDPANPYGLALRLRVMRGLGAPQEQMKETFEAAIAKYPNFYGLYREMLSGYNPKWGGTIPAMYAFVKQYAERAPTYSPLKMLYLDLYNDLLDIASISCMSYWGDNDQAPQCVKAVMEKIVTPDLDDRALSAFQLYDHTDKYQFGVFVGEIIGQMLKTNGGDLFASIMLQAAADAMHSDTQLSEDKPHANDYVVDALVAQSWYARGFYDNALKKNREALKDSTSTHFPNEEERDVALANIYEAMAGVYNKLNQYVDLAAYERAAIALRRRTGYEHLVCYAYYQLKDYDAAIRACTDTINDQTANLTALFWRASAYEDAGNKDAALKDFTIVAGSEGDYRASAAISLSMIYFGRGDNRSALNVLNQYKYLYDPNLSYRSDIAVAYNNRCYALMQLGELRDALTDCTASLKYGNIPDAYRKEQELLKRLGKGQSGL